MYMLDSDQEPSYNLLKNLLLLPRILKLIEDMVDDSTPLMYDSAQAFQDRIKKGFHGFYVPKMRVLKKKTFISVFIL